MPSKTDARYEGKGAPQTKMKVEGGYRIRYLDTRIYNKNLSVTSPVIVTFSGLTEDPKGHIDNVGTGSQADHFTATTKTLASYAGRKCTNPQDIRIKI